MSEQTPEQLAQQELTKVISAEAQKLAQQHINVVQLRAQALQLAMPFFNPKEKGFNKDVLEVAEIIMKFLASGEK